jgi:hypothetical protein
MASTVQINFRIGGIDAVRDALNSISRASTRAIQQGVREEQRAGRERVGTAKQTEAAVAREKRAAEREVARALREQQRAERRINTERVAEEKKMAREVVAVVRQANREKLAAEREVDREQRRIANQARTRAEQSVRERQRLLGGMVGGAVSGAASGVRAVGRGAGSLLRGGMGLASTLMTGAGIEAGLGRGVRVASERATLATDLVNASVSGEKGEMMTMVDRQKKAAGLTKTMQEIGSATAMDPTALLEGLGKFVGKTGDLETGVASMRELAIIARATGSSVSDVASAAGDVSANLGDMPNKGKVVAQVMRVFAGQGKLGAVEIKDLSKQMAGLAAQASMFGTDSETAMASLGALTQESRQRGGSKSAAQAVTSSQAFVNTFNKGRADEAFKSLGVQYKDEKGLLDPEQIITNALRATGGDSVKMGKLFADVRARSATLGFESIYRKAGGGEAGISAVKEEFAKLRGATLGKGDEAAAFAASMETPEAKAQKFQQRIDELSMQMADKLMPAMLKFVPVAEKGADVLLKFVDAVAPNADQLAASLGNLAPLAARAAEALAKIISMASGSPGTAASLVVGGMVAKGVIGAAAGNAAVQSAVGAGVAGVGGKLATGAAGLASSSVGASIAAGTVGFGLTYAGLSYADDKSKDKRDQSQKLINESVGLRFKIGSGQGSEADVARAQALVAQLGKVGENTSVVDKVLGNSREDQAKAAASDLSAALSKATMKLDPSTQVQIAPGTELTVRVSNAGEIAAAGNIQQPKAQTE